jgi:type VI secretion system secreted protein Hcp
MSIATIPGAAAPVAPQTAHKSPLTIYAQFEGTLKGKGGATEKEHSKWFVLNHLSYHIMRQIHTVIGHAGSRDMTKPEISSVAVTMPMNSTEPLIAQEAVSGEPISKVTIHFCKTGPKGLVKMQQLVLSNVYISKFAVNTSAEDPRNVVSFDLNFSEFEITGYPYDTAAKQQAPNTFGYSLVTGAPK